MKHGSLFSGIGGFDLAAEWAGWENVFHCEWNEFGQKVLKYHFPKAITHNDITKTDFTTYRDRIDVLTGGFPCQPYSSAGKRLGKEDERHLWPEMLRAIREIKPSWVVGENVLGLVNWNGGLVFEEVQSDLEAEGYEVQPYILPAAGVGAPHRRDRVWFVAHKNTDKNGRSHIEREKEPKKRGQRNVSSGNNERICPYNAKNRLATYSDKRDDRRTARKDAGKGGEERGQERNAVRESVESGEVFGDPSNSDNTRADKRVRDNGNGKTENKGRQEQPQLESWAGRGRWENFPTKPPICGGNDGLPRELDGITFPTWRNESIKAYGNAIVPQVAYQIFKAINEYNKNQK